MYACTFILGLCCYSRVRLSTLQSPALFPAPVQCTTQMIAAAAGHTATPSRQYSSSGSTLGCALDRPCAVCSGAWQGTSSSSSAFAPTGGVQQHGRTRLWSQHCTAVHLSCLLHVSVQGLCALSAGREDGAPTMLLLCMALLRCPLTSGPSMYAIRVMRVWPWCDPNA